MPGSRPASRPLDVARLQGREAELILRPTVVGYSRLEPLGLTTGDLRPGLQALLGDPLWLVGRQWQFEELRGEDGGSPIMAEVATEHAGLTRFHPGPLVDGADPATGSVGVPGPALPVEVAVEAERLDVPPDRLRAQLGLHLLRMVRAAGLPPGITARIVKAMLDEWPLGGEPPPAEENRRRRELDPTGARRRARLRGKVPDPVAAAADLRKRLTAKGAVRSLPKRLNQAAGTDPRRARLREVLGHWLSWTQSSVAAPVGESWLPGRLEYSFALQAQLGQNAVVLRADEHSGGSVDWHTFDAAGGPSLGGPAPAAPRPSPPMQVIPTVVRYPGMPSDRLWAFEDADVYLGGVEAGPTDLARLALVEFSLVFGTDWFLVPVTLPFGCVARVTSLTVVDTFGERIPVSPSRDTSRPGWTAFQNTPVTDASPLADVMVVPTAVLQPLESPPLEEVALFRDEGANLVWGVERVVQGPFGEPVRRGLVESRSLRQQLPGDLGDAAIVYRLMTPVPEHWVPFVSVPVRLPGQPLSAFATELERRPMVRFLDDGSVDVAHPHGVLLREDPAGDVAQDRLRIADEEVPRDGVVLTRAFHRARTPGGGTVLWVGRRKRAGKGEGSSGLKFDTALPPGGL